MSSILSSSELIKNDNNTLKPYLEGEGVAMTAMSHSKINEVNTREARQFRLLYVVCFMLFLVAAVIGRVFPAKWRNRITGSTIKRSVIGEAKAAADTIVPFAFMA